MEDQKTRARGHRVFVLAALFVAVHLLDHLLIVQNISSHLGFAVAALLTLVAAFAYPKLGSWRAPVAVFFGMVWALLFPGLQGHLLPMLRDGPSPGDYTGTAYALAGPLLLGLGLWIALSVVAQRRRPQP